MVCMPSQSFEYFPGYIIPRNSVKISIWGHPSKHRRGDSNVKQTFNAVHDLLAISTRSKSLKHSKHFDDALRGAVLRRKWFLDVNIIFLASLSESPRMLQFDTTATDTAAQLPSFASSMTKSLKKPSSERRYCFNVAKRDFYDNTEIFLL